MCTKTHGASKVRTAYPSYKIPRVVRDGDNIPRRNGRRARCERRYWHVLRSGLKPPAQEAELVALRVGQDVPLLVAGLPDVGRTGAEGEQPFELGVLVRQAMKFSVRRRLAGRQHIIRPWRERDAVSNQRGRGL
jgi:hypothetical protein